MQHLFQVLGLRVVHRLQEVLLDVVVQGVLQIGHLLQRLSRLDQGGRVNARVFEILKPAAVGAHRFTEGSLGLWVGRGLGLARQLRDPFDGRHLGSDRRVRLQVFLRLQLDVLHQLVEQVCDKTPKMLKGKLNIPNAIGNKADGL